jgi:crotonobetainyl-CoA:carnitine CoA-transferase CaiB-like acyl-CoA transferase
MPMGPLDGLRVIDCTHVLAGAWCSMLLADLGADVVKIEPPAGDVTRLQIGAFHAYDFVNRNKRAIAVDLERPEGAAVLGRLGQSADVWVENYRPGALEKLGLGYADLSRLNARLIYCSISGFGQDGPYRERGALDLVAQAMSGLMSIVGEPGQPPVSTGVPMADLNAGTFGALGVLAALNHRAKTGEGQHVDTSLLESAVAYMVWESGLYLRNGEVAGPTGSRHRLAAPYQAMKTKDGYIVIGISSDSLWLRFLKAIGAEELNQDPRFGERVARLDHRDELQQILERKLTQETSAAWVEKLLPYGIPCGPINTIDKALADPQVRARGIITEFEGQSFVGSPLHFSRTPPGLRRGPAQVGEHSREVLTEAGFGAEEIADLLASDVIIQSKPQESA